MKGKTVLLAGAGCAAGMVLARGYACAGAQVVAMDHAASALSRIARAHPARIDTLRLNPFDRAQVASFANIWASEPLHALVFLQPVRRQVAPAAAIASATAMFMALCPALVAGSGAALVVLEATPAGASLSRRVFDPALESLAGTLQAAGSGTDIRVNALSLATRRSVLGETQFLQSALYLTAPGASAARGSVLHLRGSD